MEVIVPSSPELDFDFRRSSSPSTPKRIREYYFSAPTSPSHLSEFYKDFDHFFSNDGGGAVATSAVPFDWEEKPGTPKSPVRINSGDDFVFDVSRDWETASLSAEELFDGGVIKPLKPPPRLQLPPAARVVGEGGASPGRKSISQTRKMIQGAFSPRHSRKNIEIDPFAVAARNAAARAAPVPERGRERSVNLPKSTSRRAARSLSPLRDTHLYQWEEEEQMNNSQKNSSPPSSVCSAMSAACGKGQKKWRLKDFFLFRSASEGRAADKDPLKKYTAAFRRSSFGGTDSPGSGSGSGSRRRGPVSAHERHYNVNRAVSEDLKKKSFLPYKQGILGRLAFNPAVHALANGFGFSRK
ncbi:hypothetical protein ABFX02_14G256500 [Erythranthe guttata]